MTMPSLLFVIAAMALIAWLTARVRASVFAGSAERRVGSVPSHHGWYVALWTLAPPLAFALLWTVTAPALVTDTVLATPAALQLPAGAFERGVILAEARALATDPAGGAFHPLARALAPAYAAARLRYDWVATAVAMLLAAAAGGTAYLRVRPDFAARRHVERIVLAGLLAASLVAILITAGIAAALVVQSLRFFAIVPADDFLFGTHWAPQAGSPGRTEADFGALPLFWGTFFIGAVIAMVVAVPTGLMSGIYLTQYAAAATRRWMKPALEVLAGIPTVVYGYVAALTVAPAVRRLGLAMGVNDASSESALAVGLVMGIMIVPFISSTADDAIAAVPSAMRDASLALGATVAETTRHVLLPAALPGVVGGILLAISRAIGETMIAVMAASSLATLTANPFASATTISKQIVDLLTGEASFENAQTLAAFALGLTLFVVTLVLNIFALAIVKRYRQAYD